MNFQTGLYGLYDDLALSDDVWIYGAYEKWPAVLAHKLKLMSADFDNFFILQPIYSSPS